MGELRAPLVSTVHVLVPAGVEDPSRPSGGNAYDLRLVDGLAERGWQVRRHDVPGGWPSPSADDRAALGDVLAGLPDRSVVLVDGLVGSAAGEELTAAGGRLEIVLLVHLPLGVGAPVDGAASERRAVAAARRVVVPSRWAAQWLVDHAGADPGRVVLAPPGADPARLAPAGDGSRLLTVGAVTGVKGQDRVLAGLAAVTDLPWTWTCVGSAEVEPSFAEGLWLELRSRGLDGRVRCAGALRPEAVGEAYLEADLVVLGSRVESYGMVVTEALAHGIPVLAPAVGGIEEALGRTPEGELPGILVDGDPASIGAALRSWLTDAARRDRLREAAARRRDALQSWHCATEAVELALRAAGSR